jgi:hypothetical protein
MKMGYYENRLKKTKAYLSVIVQQLYRFVTYL